ncbi:MAG: TIGR01212 family radical SAM protein [Clostridiales bacterium]|nr:TIGR01212 family radical SAM protein [Clostridiales bacterium]
MQNDNPFPHSLANKRYYTFDWFLKEKFGQKCFKIPLDAGFTCPNRDGSKGTGGCTFCSAKGSGDCTPGPLATIQEQFAAGKETLHRKWPEAKYIAYFQAFTNTYAPLSKLQKLYETALAQEGVVGLSIATRADCLPDDIVRYLHTLSRQTFLMVELGLQTIHDATAKRVNRGHTYQEFLEGYQKLEGIPRCIHLINGLPGESADMMQQSAREIAALKPDFLKIHLLHVLRGTRLAEEFEKGRFDTLSLAEYVKIVCDQLEMLPAETVIGRITGDGLKEDLIAPLWSLKKFVVMNEIDKELVRRGSWQGKFYHNNDKG